MDRLLLVVARERMYRMEFGEWVFWCGSLSGGVVQERATP